MLLSKFPTLIWYSKVRRLGGFIAVNPLILFQSGINFFPGVDKIVTKIDIVTAQIRNCLHCNFETM